MANNNGKKFEQAVKKSAEQTGLLFERFPDSNKFGQQGSKVRFTMSSPCDCFIYNGSKLCYLELKSTINTSVSFNQPPYKKGGTPMIKPHQVVSLMQRSHYPNTISGLLIDFADRTNSKGEVIEGGTYFVEIKTFIGWCSNHSKKSINKADCEVIGIPINRYKKKVNYTYDLNGLFKRF